MMLRRHALALLAAAALSPALPAQAQTTELSFGLISTESSSGLKNAWQPVFDALQKSTGLSIKAYFAPDYAGVIEAMRFNKIQFGWFGNKAAIEAVDRAQGEVFAKVVAKDGSEGYYLLLVVPVDSPLKSLDDVIRNRASLTLGFGDPNSTSGSVVPGYFAFGLNKVDPAKDFKRMVRANHETNLLAAANKQVDVATNNTENWDRLALTHPDKLEKVREIWRSPMIPSDPLVWRKDLPADVKAKLRDFFLAYGKQPAEREALAPLGYSGFRASSDAQLVSIRKIELVKDKAKIEADAALTADDRARKVADIDKRLAALGS